MPYFANREMREPARTASVTSGAYVFEGIIALSSRGADSQADPVQVTPAREGDTLTAMRDAGAQERATG